MSLERNLLMELAGKYGTPLFVYDGDMIVQRYNDLYNYIKWPQLKIHYAMKDNYNFNLLKMLNEAGASLGAATPLDMLANILRVRRKPEPAAQSLAPRSGPNLVELAHAHYHGINAGSKKAH